MIEAVVTTDTNTIVISPQLPEVIASSTQSSIAVGVPEHQNTVITGLLGPRGPGITIRSFEFERSLTWEVVHNMNTTSLIPILVDETGNQFFAKIQIIDTNRFTVHMTWPVAGSVNVLFRE